MLGLNIWSLSTFDNFPRQNMNTTGLPELLTLELPELYNY